VAQPGGLTLGFALHLIRLYFCLVIRNLHFRSLVAVDSRTGVS